MNNHLNMLPKQASVGGWGSASNPAGELTTRPNPLIMRENRSHHKFLAMPLRQMVDLDILKGCSLKVFIFGKFFLVSSWPKAF